jgi:DNA-binding SARP family transcriptional activator
VRFELLGPLRVTTDEGVSIRVTRARQRSLLTVLLLYANQPLSAGQLSESQRDGETSCSGSALRTHIWQLRRCDPALAERLRTVPGGYLVRVAPHELDLYRFRAHTDKGRQALRMGDHQTVVTELTAARALWRSPELADLRQTPAMAAAASRLMDERLIVDEHLTTARLALGDHRELLGELRERVAVDPLAERSWEQLALALYRSGRQAEALDSLMRARTTLADQYGVDPGPGLRELHMRILAGDPALELRQTVSAH